MTGRCFRKASSRFLSALDSEKSQLSHFLSLSLHHLFTSSCNIYYHHNVMSQCHNVLVLLTVILIIIIIIIYRSLPSKRPPFLTAIYNQPRLGGGRLFEHPAIEPWNRPPTLAAVPQSSLNSSVARHNGVMHMQA